MEDVYEALIQSSPALKFGVAFNEASEGYEAMPGGEWGLGSRRRKEGVGERGIGRGCG